MMTSHGWSIKPARSRWITVFLLNFAQQPYFEKCIEKFNEQYPDVKVTLEPSSWDEYWTKLEAGATGGSIADVFWMNGPNIMKYADGDVLMDISDRIKEDNIDTVPNRLSVIPPI